MNSSLLGGATSHKVLYNQLSSKVEKSHIVYKLFCHQCYVTHNFQEQRLRVLSACIQKPSKKAKKKKAEKKRKRETESMTTERKKAYLLTEDQLVIKEEEDSLLATSIRLIDP